MHSRARALVLIPVLTALLCAPAPAAFAHSGEQAPSLYQRLGGYDAIAAVVDDFIGRLVGDPQLGQFFTGHSTDSKQRIRQLIVDQLCAATGGPCVYKGRDMKTSHAGLGITGAQWELTVKHLQATFEKLKVPAELQAELVAILKTLQGDIVEAE